MKPFCILAKKLSQKMVHQVFIVLLDIKSNATIAGVHG